MTWKARGNGLRIYALPIENSWLDHCGQGFRENCPLN